MIKIGIVFATLVALIVAGFFLHRFCLQLEARGYIYYRNRPESGAISGAMRELDQLVRPTTEHTIQAEENLYAKEDDEQGGEDL